MDVGGRTRPTHVGLGALGKSMTIGTDRYGALEPITTSPDDMHHRGARDRWKPARSGHELRDGKFARASMPNFETFSRSLLQLKAEPQITLLRRGNVSLNRSAFTVLGSPDAVELLYDTCERIIGLRPTDPRASNAYVVRQPTGSQRGPFVITAMAFTKFYDIDTSTSLRRNAYLDDGVLCVCLNDAATPVTSNRARPDNVTARANAIEEDHLPDLGEAEASP